MIDLSEKKILPTKILLRPKKDEAKTTASGILIPETANKVSSQGTVVLMGDSVKKMDNFISIGSQILYSPHAIIKVRYEDEDFGLLNVQDILLAW
jgi:co-chaperonin GroES (HSP10)